MQPILEVCIKIICIISQEVIADNTKLAIHHWIRSVGSEFVDSPTDSRSGQVKVCNSGLAAIFI
jgi:hypothetical protein